MAHSVHAGTQLPSVLVQPDDRDQGLPSSETQSWDWRVGIVSPLTGVDAMSFVSTPPMGVFNDVIYFPL